MKLFEMEPGNSYEIISLGNLDEDSIKELNEIGFIENEIIYKDMNVTCNKNLCMFNIENTLYSVNKRSIEEIEIRLVDNE